MANDIIDHGRLIGYMGGGWWRPEGTHSPTNARVMEHISTLSWFYANERSWNTREEGLYRDPALLARLEAAVGYYVSLQLADGSYPEYKGRTSLAATTFGIVAQCETYEALRRCGVAPGSRRILRRSIDRAVGWFMDERAAHWTPPISYFNQLVAGIVGAQHALTVLDDPPASQAQVAERMSYLCENGVSTAGFPHEPLGMDFSYNFTVAMPDLAWLYSVTRHPGIVPLAAKYVEFMRYAIVREPGDGLLSHVPALHSRKVVSDLYRPAGDLTDRAAMASGLLPQVPALALFLPSREDKQSSRARFRTAHEEVPPLKKPHTSPRTWMYGSIAPDGPAARARDTVEASLPIIAERRFTKLADGSVGDRYLFVRRPSYYAVSLFGSYSKGLSTRQLGTLWAPRMGTVLSGTNDPASPEGWETTAVDGSFSTRQSSSKVSYYEDAATAPQALSPDVVSACNSLFTLRTSAVPRAGEYEIIWRYWDDGVSFRFLTDHDGPCEHRLPLLLKGGDRLLFSGGEVFEEGGGDMEVETSGFLLERDGHRVLFDLDARQRRVVITRSKAKIAGGAIHRVAISFKKEINVSVAFLGGADSTSVAADAQANRDGSTSVRVVLGRVDDQLPTRVRVSAAGLSEDLKVPDVNMFYAVLETTLGITRESSNDAVRVETYDAKNRRAARITTPSVRRDAS